MGRPRSIGGLRDLVLAALEKLGPKTSLAAIVRAVGDAHSRTAIYNAVARGVRAEEIARDHDGRLTLLVSAPQIAPSGAPAVPPHGANSAAPAAIAGDLSPGVGTRCAVLPENRAQGTIQEALRVVLAVDLPQTTDEVFDALPAGWARTDALRALREGAWEGWINFVNGAWTLVGDPPETRAEGPLLVIDIPSHARMRLEEIRGELNELLVDAIRLHNGPRLIRAIANAYAEVDTALDEIHA
jgi:hypothetical protein